MEPMRILAPRWALRRKAKMAQKARAAMSLNKKVAARSDEQLVNTPGAPIKAMIPRLLPNTAKQSQMLSTKNAMLEERPGQLPASTAAGSFRLPCRTVALK